MNDSPRGKCDLVIVFELYGSVYRPKSECVWIVLCFEHSGAGIATRSYVTLYIIRCLLSM